MDSIVFVDVEASGPCPGIGKLTEFGAVHYVSRDTFYGALNGAPNSEWGIQVFMDFKEWLLTKTCGKRPVFVSDNVAFDWQWINHGFHHSIGENPFGHSGRRISDFYAGLVGDWRKTQTWKGMRITPHDHNPVHDAQGNAEAFERILKGELGLKAEPAAIGCAVLK